MIKVRNSKGQFKKGESGNSSGRPKTAKIEEFDRKELGKLFDQCIKDKDLSKLISWLMARCNNTQEAFKIIKEFAPYIMPKLSSTKIEENQVTELKITFAGENTEPLKIANPIILEVENEST